MKTSCHYRDHPMFIIIDHSVRSRQAGSDSQARQPQLHAQVQPAVRLKIYSQQADTHTHTTHICTTGHTDHRQTHKAITPTASSCSSLWAGVGAPRASAQLQLLAQTIAHSWLGLPGPPVPNPTGLARGDTQAHTRVLTLESP